MKNLTKNQCAIFLESLFSDKISFEDKKSMLLTYTQKGETVDEIVTFIRLLRSKMIKLPINNYDNFVDACGTGGDGKLTFNISTATSLVVAAAGVPIVKHCNRAASGKCGSADILEALGANIYLSPPHAKRIFDKLEIVFLFAPLYNPHFKIIAPIRKNLGVATIFNYVGPFLNPTIPSRQLIGVSSIQMAQKLAIVASKLNYKHLMIISSFDGIDEASLSAPTKLFEIRGKNVQTGILYPSDYGFKTGVITDIQSNKLSENISIIQAVLRGKPGHHADIVALNTAVALYVAGLVDSINAGVEVAKKIIHSGKAYKLLQRFINESNSYEKYTGYNNRT